jgi:hypothetical protein
MAARVFKNLYDTRWFAAIALLVVLFVPFDTVVVPHHLQSTLLQHVGVQHWFDYNPGVIGRIGLVLMTLLLCASFHILLSVNKIIPSKNFVGLLYTAILVAVWLPIFASFSDIFTGGFIVLGMYNLFHVEHAQNPILSIFNAAFCISLAVVLNLHALPFILLPFIALLLFRQALWNLWAAALAGLIIPQVLVSSVEFLLYDNISWLSMVFGFFADVELGVRHFVDFPIHWISMSPFLIIGLWGFLNRLGDKKIVIRKKSMLVFWMFSLAVILLFVNNAPLDILILFIALPSGFFIASSMKFLSERKLFIFLTDIGIITLIIFNFI